MRKSDCGFDDLENQVFIASSLWCCACDKFAHLVRGEPLHNNDDIVIR